MFIAAFADVLKRFFRQVPQVGGVDVVAPLDAPVDVRYGEFCIADLVGRGVGFAPASEDLVSGSAWGSRTASSP